MSKSELVLKQTLGIMWVLLWVLGYGHVLLSVSHRFPVASHVIPRLCGFCMELKVSTYPHPMELYQISRNPIDLSFRIMWYCLGQTHTNPKACYCTWKMCRTLRNAQQSHSKRQQNGYKEETVIVFVFDIERSSPYQGHTNIIYCANHVDNFSKQIHSHPHQRHHF